MGAAASAGARSAHPSVTRSEDRMLTVFFSPNMVNASVRIGLLIGTFENRITRREGACRPGYSDKLASAWSWGGAVNGRGVLRWLGDKGQRVGILILLVSLLALYFNVRSYYMQQSSSMPNLISFGSKIYSDHQTASVALSWFNIGKGAVIRGRAFQAHAVRAVQLAVPRRQREDPARLLERRPVSHSRRVSRSRP